MSKVNTIHSFKTPVAIVEIIQLDPKASDIPALIAELPHARFQMPNTAAINQEVYLRLSEVTFDNKKYDFDQLRVLIASEIRLAFAMTVVVNAFGKLVLDKVPSSPGSGLNFSSPATAEQMADRIINIAYSLSPKNLQHFTGDTIESLGNGHYRLQARLSNTMVVAAESVDSAANEVIQQYEVENGIFVGTFELGLREWRFIVRHDQVPLTDFVSFDAVRHEIVTKISPAFQILNIFESRFRDSIKQLFLETDQEE